MFSVKVNHYNFEILKDFKSIKPKMFLLIITTSTIIIIITYIALFLND